MVDVAEIQAAYYMVAATGVLIAAIYYIVNMRATLATRRISLAESISSRLVNLDGYRMYFEMRDWEWEDYEDFRRKYGSVDSNAVRFTLWNSYNELGSMLRKGLVKAEDLYDLGMYGIIFFWVQFKPIVEETRKRYNGLDYLRDLEFLANEMMRIKLSRDPSFLDAHPERGFTPQ